MSNLIKKLILTGIPVFTIACSSASKINQGTLTDEEMLLIPPHIEEYNPREVCENITYRIKTNPYINSGIPYYEEERVICKNTKFQT